MTIDRFLAYVQFSEECPTDVHPLRWKGMLLWLKNYWV